MSTIKLTFDYGSGAAYIDSDWIIGRHQYDGRTLVVYGYDTTLWVSETAEEIDRMMRGAAGYDECAGKVYGSYGDEPVYGGLSGVYSETVEEIDRMTRGAAGCDECADSEG